MNESFEKWARTAGKYALRAILQTAISAIAVSLLLSRIDWGVIIPSSLLSGILSIISSALTELK